jgi:hypothetical protein
VCKGNENEWISLFQDSKPSTPFKNWTLNQFKTDNRNCQSDAEIEKQKPP